MKGSLALLCILFATALLRAELVISRFSRPGTLTWTNSVTSAVYRIESAPSLSGPWTTLPGFSSIQASNAETSVQLGAPGAEPAQLFRVVWAEVPPAQPVGVWTYQGFDSSGGLVVTGRLSILSSNPVSGNCVFASPVAGPPPIHPVGSGAFTDGVIINSNKVQIPLPGFQRDNFRLSGQMTFNEYWGWWYWTDTRIDSSGRSQIIGVSGRFSARRAE